VREISSGSWLTAPLHHSKQPNEPIGKLRGLTSPYGRAELFRIETEIRFRALYFRECDGAHRAQPVPLLESRTRRTISIPHQEDDMVSRATRFALVFGMAFATALTILAITTWARAPDSQSEWTAPIAPKQPIYRPQLHTVF